MKRLIKRFIRKKLAKNAGKLAQMDQVQHTLSFVYLICTIASLLSVALYSVLLFKQANRYYKKPKK